MRAARRPLRMICSGCSLAVTLFALGATFAVLSAVASPQIASAEETCDQCVQSKRQPCGVRCQNSLSREQYDTCSDRCVASACDKVCVAHGVPAESLLANPHARCERCIREKEQGECYTECLQTTSRTTACTKKCARKKCGEICDVTDIPVVEDPKNTKLECETCRRAASATCLQREECRAGQPGSVACQLNCVTTTCQRKCVEDDEDE